MQVDSEQSDASSEGFGMATVLSPVAEDVGPSSWTSSPQHHSSLSPQIIKDSPSIGPAPPPEIHVQKQEQIPSADDISNDPSPKAHSEMPDRETAAVQDPSVQDPSVQGQGAQTSVSATLEAVHEEVSAPTESSGTGTDANKSTGSQQPLEDHSKPSQRQAMGVPKGKPSPRHAAIARASASSSKQAHSPLSSPRAAQVKSSSSSRSAAAGANRNGMTSLEQSLKDQDIAKAYSAAPGSISGAKSSKFRPTSRPPWSSSIASSGQPSQTVSAVVTPRHAVKATGGVVAVAYHSARTRSVANTLSTVRKVRSLVACTGGDGTLPATTARLAAKELMMLEAELHCQLHALGGGGRANYSPERQPRPPRNALTPLKGNARKAVQKTVYADRAFEDERLDSNNHIQIPSSAGEFNFTAAFDASTGPASSMMMDVLPSVTKLERPPKGRSRRSKKKKKKADSVAESASSQPVALDRNAAGLATAPERGSRMRASAGRSPPSHSRQLGNGRSPERASTAAEGSAVLRSGGRSPARKFSSVARPGPPPTDAMERPGTRALELNQGVFKFRRAGVSVSADGIEIDGTAAREKGSAFNALQMECKADQFQVLQSLSPTDDSPHAIELMLARDTRTGKDVLIKVYSVQGSENRRTLHGEVVGSVECRGLHGFSRFFGAFLDASKLTVSVVHGVCELGSLRTLMMDKGAIPERFVAGILRQLLVSLDALHHRGIIFNNICPKSIHLTHRGEVRLQGFSHICRPATSGLEEPQGDIRFAAPERLLKLQVDLKSDVWSLGMVAVQLLMGVPLQSPSQFPSLLTFKQVVVEGTLVPESLLSSRSHVGPEMRDFISACLSRYPRNRQSAKELRDHPLMRRYDFVTPADLLRFTKGQPDIDILSPSNTTGLSNTKASPFLTSTA